MTWPKSCPSLILAAERFCSTVVEAAPLLVTSPSDCTLWQRNPEATEEGLLGWLCSFVADKTLFKLQRKQVKSKISRR